MSIIKRSPWISFFNAGGCIPGDTMMILDDGEILSAKEIIEEKLEGNEFSKMIKGQVLARACEAGTISWNCTSPKTGKITEAYKLPSNGKLIEIKTSTTKLKLTPEHKVLVDSKNGPVWKKAAELKRNDHLFSPRKLNVKNKWNSPNIFEWLSDDIIIKLDINTKGKIRKKLKTKFGNLRKASEQCKISYKRLVHSTEGLTVKELQSISQKIKVDLKELSKEIKEIVNGTDLCHINTKQIDTDLVYILGLIASDGSISGHKKTKRKSYKIRFDNNEKVLIQNFVNIFREWVPNAKITQEKQDKLHRVYAYHYPFAIFATYFGLKGLERKELDLRKIFKMPEDHIASFLAGFFDGDGSAVIQRIEGRKKVKKSLEISIKGYRTAKLIQLLLKRLGIISKVIASINRSTFGTKVMHSVRITTNYDILEFIKKIHIKHPKKKRNFVLMKKEILKDKTNLGKTYHAPLICGKLIKEIRKKHNIKSSSILNQQFLSMIENGKRVDKETITRICEKLEKKVGMKRVQELRKHISNESYLDPVKSIKKIKTKDKFVYNFNIAETHKYIPEGAFVVSNCNGCTLECFACFNPKYDITRFGMELKQSAKHADVLLVTGIVNKQNVARLKHIYEQLPKPKRVVAIGACAVSAGLYKKSYALAGPVDKVIPVDVYIPGCPPRPEAIINGIVKCLNDKNNK